MQAPLLEFRSPRLGLAWSHGNPAGLVDEIDGTWTQLAISSSKVSGTYHVPLDPSDIFSNATTLTGRGRVGTRMAAVGKISVAQDNVQTGYGAFSMPLRSSPFAPADTNRPLVQRPFVALEGAEGITLGQWRLGIGAGYQGVESAAAQSAAALIGRSSRTGLTFGVARSLGEATRAGLYARRLLESETVNLVANPRTVRMFSLAGYADVEPVDYIAALPAFVRRADRSRHLVGTDVVTHVDNVTFASFIEGHVVEERQISDVLSPQPPTDRWRTGGYAAGGAAQAVFRGTMTTLSAEWTTQRGDATRASDTTSLQIGQPFAAHASQLALDADLRYAVADSSWRGSLSLSLSRDHQDVNDAVAHAATDVTAWSSAASFEVSRQVGPRWTIAAGWGFTQYVPIARLPDPTGRENAYRLLIEPALEVSAAMARGQRASAAARWASGSHGVSLLLSRSVLAPIALSPAAVRIPSGESAAWSVALRWQSTR
ncbi:MAG TPA: hypothetical protein VF929_02980 [Gemmatimonadaceae bacterium]